MNTHKIKCITKPSISDEYKNLKDSEHRCDEGLFRPLKSDIMSFQAVHAIPWKAWKDLNAACNIRAACKNLNLNKLTSLKAHLVRNYDSATD